MVNGARCESSPRIELRDQISQFCVMGCKLWSLECFPRWKGERDIHRQWNSAEQDGPVLKDGETNEENKSRAQKGALTRCLRSHGFRHECFPRTIGRGTI